MRLTKHGISVVSDHPKATEKAAEALIDVFSENWLEGSSETETLDVNLGGIHYKVSTYSLN